MPEYNAVDLFSGVGGFSLGLKSAGFNVVAGVDNHDTTVETYNKNFPSTTAINVDIKSVNADEILQQIDVPKSEIDIVVGGPPCQGFSVIGKNDPDDERNDLLLEFARHLVDMSPKYFILENVPGLLSDRTKYYLEKFLEIVNKNGYEINKPIRKIDASEYGVPQTRERVFILGSKNSVPEIKYPKPTCSPVSVWDAIGDLPSELPDEKIKDGVFTGKLGEKSEYVRQINRELGEPQKSENITGMDPVDHCDRVRNRFATVPQGGVDEISRYPRLDKKEPSNTLRAGSDRSRGTHTPARPIHPEANRCITVREAARLQSFPDWFEFHHSKYHGLRQIGNSVPPLVAKAISQQALMRLEGME